MTEKGIFDTQLRGVTIKMAWQFFAGWTSLVAFAIYAYLNVIGKINEFGLGQSRVDAIQDVRIDAMKRDIDLQTLQIKDLKERYDELKLK